MTQKTPLYDWHQQHGAKVVDFAGWLLPVSYADGLIAEHLATRKFGGIFDVSHMGRFLISGPGALGFLNATLSNYAGKLKPGQAQYTIISDEHGRPLDDAFLYRWGEDEYLLVVNAANKTKAWQWLSEQDAGEARLDDVSSQYAMLAVQGPLSEALLAALLEAPLPEPGRNNGAWTKFDGMELFVSRTGYTGEPVGFELFPPWQEAARLAQALADQGAEIDIKPVGLGARDTLRLEACLPLYGREYEPERPIMATPTARFGVDLSASHGDFMGKVALAEQKKALDSGDRQAMPRRIMAVAALDKGMMREGSQVLRGSREVGMLTSATTVPAWRFDDGAPTDQHYNRALGLAFLDADLEIGQQVEIAYRKRILNGVVAKAFASPVGPYLKPIEF